MSRLITPFRLAVLAVMLLLTSVRPSSYAQDGYGDASYQQFYDELSPYGEWIDDPRNGYVWVPDAGDDFRPYYTNGYWAHTEFGNTWVSNYSWGWAPFHYGRWTYTDFYGWVWIPGNEWGPAWVSWRSGGDCYGWAPLGPGISINLSFGSNYYVPDYWWTFAPQQYILSPNFHRYSYGPRYNTNYIRQTTIINNTYVYNNRTYVTGPRRNDLERATGRSVQVVNIRNSSRPDRAQIRGNELNMYRPAIARSQPRATERPREFRRADRPVITAPPATATSADRSRINSRQDALQREGATRVTDRPFGRNAEIANPRIDQRPADRMPSRVTESQVRQEMQRNRNDWSNGRLPDRAPMQPRMERPEMPSRRMDRMDRVQQMPQPQPRIERAPVNRGFEQQRFPQAQPMQQRIERPAVQPQIQRMERPMMQQQPQMQRMERPMMQQQSQMQRTDRPAPRMR